MQEYSIDRLASSQLIRLSCLSQFIDFILEIGKDVAGFHLLTELHNAGRDRLARLNVEHFERNVEGSELMLYAFQVAQDEVDAASGSVVRFEVVGRDDVQDDQGLVGCSSGLGSVRHGSVVVDA